MDKFAILTMFSDGTLMESSRERRKDAPFLFMLGSIDIIEGISMAVRTFGQGERSKVKIASELGYGTSTFVLVSPAQKY
jgi:FKBP-type peptidyl-prolyl cis-trans isomerase